MPNPRILLARLCVPFLLLLSADLAAEETETSRSADLRGVLIGGVEGAPFASYICGDFALSTSFSFVGCGTASETFLTPQLGAELSHYRLEYGWQLNPLMNFSLGAGMAEAQLGQDAAGFFFNPESDLSTIEAAGGELALGLDFFVPTAVKTQMRIRLDLGMAWLPGWREVGGNSEDVVPFGLITTNAEF